MEKTGEIRVGVTPAIDKEKKASADQLEDCPQKRLSKVCEDKLAKPK